MSLTLELSGKIRRLSTGTSIMKEDNNCTAASRVVAFTSAFTVLRTSPTRDQELLHGTAKERKKGQRAETPRVRVTARAVIGTMKEMFRRESQVQLARIASGGFALVFVKRATIVSLCTWATKRELGL